MSSASVHSRMRWLWVAVLTGAAGTYRDKQQQHEKPCYTSVLPPPPHLSEEVVVVVGAVVAAQQRRQLAAAVVQGLHVIEEL